MLPLIYKEKPKNGANASNNMVRVVINPDLKHYYAILAQELFEFWWKWIWGRGFILPFSKSMQRKMEIQGHEVEVQWAVHFDKEDEENYRTLEAKALTRYKAFKGIPFEEIYDEMIKYSTKGRRWVLKNTKYVYKKGS